MENDENPSDKKSILRNKSQFCCGYLKGREIEILYKYFLISRRFGVITSYARKLGLATTAWELKVAIRDPRTRADRSKDRARGPSGAWIPGLLRRPNVSL